MSAAETGGGGGGGGITTLAMSDSFPVPTIQISSLKPVLQTLSFPYASSSDGNSAAYKPVLSASSPPYQPEPTVLDGVPGGSANSNVTPGDQLKRKRGRPRKYNPDGSITTTILPATLTQPPPQVTIAPPAGNFYPSVPHHSEAASQPPGRRASPSSSMKKARGRPTGSSKKQQGIEASGSVGIGFKPHVIIVQAGEDVSAKIMSFSQHGPRAICILSATGAISNVTIRQAATSGGTATYEGRFDILSLSGSFLLSEFGGQRSRTGGLSVTLAGPDGRVIGGCVAGLLTAASPVQVIVGSFMADGRKQSKSKNHMEPLSAPLKVYPGGASGASSPPSRGTSESSGGPGSPFCQGSGTCDNVNPQVMSMEWN